MTEGWLRDHQTKAEGVANMNENEQQSSGSNTSKGKASRRTQDLQVVAQELQDGAAYICSKWKLQVKAPTLESLDNAIDKISRSYIDLFGSVSVAAYPGEQRNELSRLFAKNEKTLGHGFILRVPSLQECIRSLHTVLKTRQANTLVIWSAMLITQPYCLM